MQFEKSGTAWHVGFMDWIVAAEICCPYCWEEFVVQIDTSQGDFESVEDCSVCCRPMTLVARCEPGRLESLEVAP